MGRDLVSTATDIIAIISMRARLAFFHCCSTTCPPLLPSSLLSEQAGVSLGNSHSFQAHHMYRDGDLNALLQGASEVLGESGGERKGRGGMRKGRNTAEKQERETGEERGRKRMLMLR